MKYRNRSYSSSQSKPPEIEKGADEVSGADREQINELFSELGVDAAAEEVLEGAETAEVSMRVELGQGSAKDYWRATMDNSKVLARHIEVEFDVEGRKNQQYEAKDVWKPAYDVFSLPSYMETEDAEVEDSFSEVSAEAEVSEAATMD